MDTDSASGNSLENFSSRQMEILRLLAHGDTVKEVGRKLHLTPKAVDSQKYRIMRKLDIHDRVHLALFAVREGLIEV